MLKRLADGGDCDCHLYFSWLTSLLKQSPTFVSQIIGDLSLAEGGVSSIRLTVGPELMLLHNTLTKVGLLTRGLTKSDDKKRTSLGRSCYVGS